MDFPLAAATGGRDRARGPSRMLAPLPLRCASAAPPRRPTLIPMTPKPEWERALEALLNRFGDRLETVASRLGLDAAERDALLQEVRVRLWRTAPEAENLGSISPSFLYGAARWAALDLLRERRRTADETEAARQMGRTAPAPDRADESLQRRRLGELIDGAVSELGPDRQTVVRLWLAGYDRGEAQQMLGWSEARTRNLLYRGLDNLREELLRRGAGLEEEGDG
jgi:RNA polymerase sigma factor (sigma-70 family)